MIRSWARSQRRVCSKRRSSSAEYRHEREGAALSVLRHPGLEPDKAVGPIDLGPGQREYLRPTPPAGDVHEASAVGLGGPEMLADGRDLIVLEKAGPHVVFAERRDHGDGWRSADLATSTPSQTETTRPAMNRSRCRQEGLYGRGSGVRSGGGDCVGRSARQFSCPTGVSKP